MSSTTERAEIEALFQQLAKAHADHDVDAIVEAYAPGSLQGAAEQPLRAMRLGLAVLVPGGERCPLRSDERRYVEES